MEKNLNGCIQSVDRAMTLLEALGQEDRGYRLSDLARSTGLSLTTVHRLLTTLQQRQFVQCSRTDNLWHIGAGAFAVGSAFTREHSIVAAARPFLRQLRDTTRETANIGIVNDCHIVLADQVPGRESSKAISAVGARTPMTASGMGKAFLSSYTKEEVASIVSRYGMKRVTRKTLTSFDALNHQLTVIEAEGYSIDDEEYRPGLRCVAAPVYNGRQEVVCALSVSGSTLRITNERVPELAKLVRQVASEFTRAVSGVFPLRIIST